MKRACEEPLRQIVSNSGTEGAIVVEKVRENDNPNFGYNAATGQYEDLVESGVIDPTKVTRTALQNAASIAPDADHRSDDLRDPGEEGRCRRSRRPRPRDGLLIHRRRSKNEKARLATMVRRAFFFSNLLVLT